MSCDFLTLELGWDCQTLYSQLCGSQAVKAGHSFIGKQGKPQDTSSAQQDHFEIKLMPGENARSIKFSVRSYTWPRNLSGKPRNTVLQNPLKMFISLERRLILIGPDTNPPNSHLPFSKRERTPMPKAVSSALFIASLFSPSPSVQVTVVRFQLSLLITSALL